MKVEIKVPAMGESITEATIGTILKPSGSKVAMDDEVLELETDKVNQVLYAPQAGVVNLTVKTDDVVKIGDVIGTVDSEGAEEPAPKPEPVKEVEKPSPPPTGEARISKEEFLKEQPAEEKKPVRVGEETRRRMSRIRRVIANRLVEAQQTTAMLTTFNEIDLSEVMALRARYKDSFEKEHGVKLGFMSFFVKATVAALQELPDLNSYIEGDEIVTPHTYDIGIAVGTEKGLVVPVVRDCANLSFGEIESSIANYAGKAREGTLAVEDLQGGTFTITNGGVYGSLLSTPILNPPQSGILGMHKIERRPIAMNDHVVIRPMMYVALSYDHRIVDGKEAVTFLVNIKNILEDPARLLLEV